MIIVAFYHLGKDVKVTVEGNKCMNSEYEDAPELAKLKKLNDCILVKNGPTYTDLYKWCKNNFHKSQRGCQTFFAV